jgi:hypothetical protein
MDAGLVVSVRAGDAQIVLRFDEAVELHVSLSAVRLRETGLRARAGRSSVLRAYAGGAFDHRLATVNRDA